MARFRDVRLPFNRGNLLGPREGQKPGTSPDLLAESSPVEEPPLEEPPLQDPPLQDPSLQDPPMEDSPMEDTPMESRHSFDIAST